jgi:tetratricopeptide (TPR) repeat protein
MAGRAALELALLDLRRGLMPEVQAPLRMALDQGERYHIPDLAAHARLGLAFLARRLGNRDEARRYLREVLIAAGGQDTEPAIEARIALAELNLDEGRPEMAVHGARMALEAAERAGPAMLVWSARRTYAVSLGATGQSAEAEVQIRRATEAARNARAYPELARCLADWTRLRGIQHGSNVTDAEAQGLLTEIREVLAYLARGGSPPQTTPPAPAAAGPRPTAG